MIFKSKKMYFIAIILFFFLFIAYNFKFQILYNSLTFLGYEENKAKKNSFIFLQNPFKITITKLRSILNPNWQEEEKFKIALDIKKNFIDYTKSSFNFNNNDYFLDNYSKTNFNYKRKLESKRVWKKNLPKKVWDLNMSNNEVLDKEALSKESKPVQASPKICGDKLIYARQDGNIGAVDYRSGKRFWHKKYGTVNAASIKGFYCEYEKKLDTFVIILPTGSGVFCINAFDGSIIKSRCGGSAMGVFETRVSPKLFDDIVYIATINPAGIEAYSFLNGKLLWRKDFQVGKTFYIGNGSNPWSNFTIDKKNKILLVNTGSPADRYALRKDDNYRYSGSLLALNLKTGKILWQFQEHKKDTWNHDFVGKPILSPVKINDKDVVITFSKSGSVYFIDRNSGKSVLPLQNSSINFLNFNYNYKKSIFPRSILDMDYYNYLGKNCNDCDLNTTIFGQVPPIIKLKRIFDGYLGGPQWPGGSIDISNEYLIFPSNHNFIVQQYHDIVPQPLEALPQEKLIQQCSTCHSKKGDVNIEDKMIVPSLFLTTKIYDINTLKKYLENNKFHKDIKFNNQELDESYNSLKKYDENLINKEQYKYFLFRNNINIKKKKDVNSKYLSLGKITAISLKTGKIMWQVPAGTYQVNNENLIVGSQIGGGLADGGNNEGISFFTGSFDEKIYAINNSNGDYLWNNQLPAAGSALPLIHNNVSERWIFVVSGGRRSANYRANNIIAFKQKLN